MSASAAADGVLGRLKIGLRRPQLRVELRRRNPRDDLTRGHFGSLVHRNLSELARIFRRNVDLFRLGASLRLDDSVGQRLAAQSRNQFAKRLGGRG
jgi:hypothetical protein